MLCKFRLLYNIVLKLRLTIIVLPKSRRYWFINNHMYTVYIIYIHIYLSSQDTFLRLKKTSKHFISAFSHNHNIGYTNRPDKTRQNLTKSMMCRRSMDELEHQYKNHNIFFATTHPQY